MMTPLPPDGRLYIGGRIAKSTSDVVAALTHHPMAIWLDSPAYSNLLIRAPVGEYRIQYPNGKQATVTVPLYDKIKVR